VPSHSAGRGSKVVAITKSWTKDLNEIRPTRASLSHRMGRQRAARMSIRVGLRGFKWVRGTWPDAGSGLVMRECAKTSKVAVGRSMKSTPTELSRWSLRKVPQGRRGRRGAMAQVPADGGLRDPQAELEQFAVDWGRAPGRVFVGHFGDEVADVFVDGRSAHSA